MTPVMAQGADRSLSTRESRAELRRYLRKAVRGDAGAFASLAAPYVDPITEYLALCGIEDEVMRRAKTGEILHDMWKFLPFMHRVADFERLLATSLFTVDDRPIPASEPAFRKALFHLDPREKFAFVARDFENWDYATTAAALRTVPKTLDEILVSVRCRLLGFDLVNLDRADSDCVRRLSRGLDGQNRSREKNRLCHELSARPAAKEFKSEWLDLRCRLIEFRQQIRLLDEDKAAFLRETTAGLQTGQMIRVPLLERLAGRLNPLRPAHVSAR